MFSLVKLFLCLFHVCRFVEKKYFVVDGGEKNLCTSRPWDFPWCSNFAFRRVLFFKKLNLTWHEICWMMMI